MDTHQQKEFVRRFIEEVVNLKDYDRLAEFVAEDALWSGTTGEIAGTQAFKQQMAATAGSEAFADSKMIIDEMVGDIDKVVVRFTHTVRSVDVFMGHDPLNAPVSWTGLAIYTLAHDKIVGIYTVEDFFALLMQLGVISLPVSAA